MVPGSVAIIDIGSNSIKLLVAARDEQGSLVSLKSKTIEARISAGISRDRPRLGDEGMAAGMAAVQKLLTVAARFSPATTVLVATSAVREAENGAEFCAQILAATGHAIRILGGDEEAGLIGRGLTVDPALSALKNFYVFDLGGGSLECLSFLDRRVTQAVSLPLGCVRLTERFHPDGEAPFSPVERTAVMEHTRKLIVDSGFAFSLSSAMGVFAGGSMTTLRAVIGARSGLRLDDTPAMIGVAEIRSALDSIATLTLAARKEVPGLPPARADVFPTALATMLAIADCGALPFFQHSFYNLRWGLADETLRAD